MILLDDESLDFKEETSEVSVTPFPTYNGRGEAEPLLPIVNRHETSSSKRKSRTSKTIFLKAFFVVWAVWGVLLVLFICVKKSVDYEDGYMRKAPKIEKRPRKKPVFQLPVDESRIRTPSCVIATPISSEPSSGEAIIFVNEDRPYRASAKFSIPTSSDLVQFFSRGSFNRGFGFIRLSVSEERRPDILVDVTISYSGKEYLETTKICLVEEKEGEMGVGIEFPLPDFDSDDEKQVRYDFEVVLPAPLDESQSELFIKRLKTNFTLVHHRLDDLLNKVRFGSVDLQTSFMPITISGLFAEEVKVRSQDGLFDGRLAANRSIDIQTSNSPISVDALLKNNDTRRPSEIILKTSHSPIDASFRFQSSDPLKGGLYVVDAETDSSHIGLYSYALPSHSTLKMKAKTTRASVTILAPPQYEGSFNSKKTPLLVEPRHVEDPEGRGRNRKIYTPQDRGSKTMATESYVWWSEESGTPVEPHFATNSSIEIYNTINPVFLKLYDV